MGQAESQRKAFHESQRLWAGGRPKREPYNRAEYHRHSAWQEQQRNDDVGGDWANALGLERRSPSAGGGRWD